MSEENKGYPTGGWLLQTFIERDAIHEREESDTFFRRLATSQKKLAKETEETVLNVSHLGFVTGYVGGILACLKGAPKITFELAVKIVEDYVALHPERSNDHAARVIADALKEVFPQIEVPPMTIRERIP